MEAMFLRSACLDSDRPERCKVGDGCIGTSALVGFTSDRKLSLLAMGVWVGSAVLSLVPVACRLLQRRPIFSSCYKQQSHYSLVPFVNRPVQRRLLLISPRCNVCPILKQQPYYSLVPFVNRPVQCR